MDAVQHVLERPDMYIGSTNAQESEVDVVVYDDGIKLAMTTLIIQPSRLKRIYSSFNVQLIVLKTLKIKN